MAVLQEVDVPAGGLEAAFGLVGIDPAVDDVLGIRDRFGVAYKNQSHGLSSFGRGGFSAPVLSFCS